VFFSFPQVTLDGSGRVLTPPLDIPGHAVTTQPSAPLSSSLGSSGSSSGSTSNASLSSSDFTFCNTSSTGSSTSCDVQGGLGASVNNGNGWTHMHASRSIPGANSSNVTFAGSTCAGSLDYHYHHHHGHQGQGHPCNQQHDHQCLHDDYAILKQRIARRMAHEKIDPAKLSLMEMTKVAERATKVRSCAG
jgi:hypothetical protein